MESYHKIFNWENIYTQIIDWSIQNIIVTSIYFDIVYVLLVLYTRVLYIICKLIIFAINNYYYYYFNSSRQRKCL